MLQDGQAGYRTPVAFSVLGSNESSQLPAGSQGSSSIN